MKRTVIFLGIVIIIAAVLRLYRLGTVPPSLDWDEASLGYNAYSLLHTGHDEYGNFLPVNLRSFNDYKPALYAYLALPSIAILGLEPFAVRLPSAVSGIVMVLLLWGILRELFADAYAIPIKKWRLGMSEIGVLVLALSPMALHFSRIAFEAHVAAMFAMLGLYTFLKGLRKHWMLSAAAISFALSMYTYQSEKVFIPLFVLIILWAFRKQLSRIPGPKCFVPVGVGLIMLIPFFFAIVTNSNTLSRAQGVSIFGHPYPQITTAVTRMIQDRHHGDIVGILFDNQKIVYAKIVVNNYLAHFNPEWLFVTGDGFTRHQATGMGHLYLIDLPFFFIGLFVLLFGKIRREVKWLLLLWILAVPIPAAISWDVPNVVRTLNFLPVLQIVIALGLLYTFYQFQSARWTSHRIRTYIGFLFIVILSIGNIGYYLNQYFVQYPYVSASAWQYGYSQAVQYISQHKNRYDKIVVSDQTPLDQSYIFFLFYLQYPPQHYQQNIQNFARGKEAYRSFDKFVFRKFTITDSDEGKVLYVGSPDDFPSSIHPIYTIRNPDGTVAAELVEKP